MVHWIGPLGQRSGTVRRPPLPVMNQKLGVGCAWSRAVGNRSPPSWDWNDVNVESPTNQPTSHHCATSQHFNFPIIVERNFTTSDIQGHQFNNKVKLIMSAKGRVTGSTFQLAVDDSKKLESKPSNDDLLAVCVC